jgi:tetratricopeptide (TPR) repeat protein
LRADLAAAANDAAARPASTQGFEEWYLQGLAAHDRGDYQAALNFYERAEDLAPDFVARARLLNSRARALWYGGHPEAAETLWTRVFQTYGRLLTERPDLAPEIAKAQVNSASSLADRGQQDSAIALCDEVLTRFGAAATRKAWPLFSSPKECSARRAGLVS